MMFNTISRTTLAMGALVGVLLKMAVAEPAGIGGNVAGSTITAIPSPTSVPFNQSCALNTFLFNGTSLGVYCHGNNWTTWDFDWTWIDLNLCVGNSAGTLIPSVSGSYASNCAGCNITWSHVLETPYNTTFLAIPSIPVTSLFTPRWDDLYLGCSGCNNGAGTTMIPSELDLNQVLVNKHGSLGCFNFNGSTQRTRPPGAHATPTWTVWSIRNSTSGPYPTAT
ncbi:hypothetical protein VM1G_02726 [Cytospora mali]|uniref:Cyanovirin-N domain-containing protein n=1 Tax=Cytospora mali TaxID=578113 RepID=A0A194VVN8_CYTMA|nr:hypothetical protein VM1G_02726 [Valsa mali]